MLNVDDDDIYAGVAGFVRVCVPQGVTIQRGQQNRVPMPSGPCVILTTLGAPERFGTNDDETLTTSEWTSDDNVSSDSSLTADAGGNTYGFVATETADFAYQVQADFYGPSAESWAMAAEILWRGKLAWYNMPAYMKPLYSEGRMQLPLVGAENQWIQRWTMTLTLDYQPTWSQATQAATAATVIPVPIDVFF